MANTYILIDFENRQPKGLAALRGGVRSGLKGHSAFGALHQKAVRQMHARCLSAPKRSRREVKTFRQPVRR